MRGTCAAWFFLPCCMASIAHVTFDGEIRNAPGIGTGHRHKKLNHSLAPAEGSLVVPVQPVVVVSSWLVVTLMGARNGLEDGSDKKELRQLTGSVRTALAEALQVCRSSLHVTDMSIKGNDDSLMEILEDHWHGKHQRHRLIDEGANVAQLMRRNSKAVLDDSFQNLNERVNFTRVKATYEVRIFPEMRVSSKDVAQRIDRLQIFSRFADLNHILVRSLIHRVRNKPAESAMLDDVGYGRREVKPREVLPALQLADCMEEGFLQDAREAHQYVIALCCILVLFITCAGSAIFSLKQPSIVPSRTNPLGPLPMR
eukprot:Skav218975  [mRNA]  locus=scaffold1532:242631:253522:+ [translate_table: standard]